MIPPGFRSSLTSFSIEFGSE
jgi:hypothetical protein